VLVTGGAGFIGSNLCEELVHRKTGEIYSLDNYSMGSEKNHVAGVNYIRGDTRNISELLTVQADLVFHLGEYSRVEQSFQDFRKVWHYNKIGTFEVLEYCKNTGAKLIYAGSSTKFGDGGLNRSESPYAWSKASNTELIKNYGDWFNLEYAIAYFYNAYGPREISSGKYSTLIAVFAEKMRKKQPLTVVSPGHQKRNFTHVSDIVEGLILIAEKGCGDNFGIGSEEEFSILEIANKFGGAIEYLPERRGNRMKADLITDKTRSLGWKCQNSIDEYIDCLRRNYWESG